MKTTEVVDVVSLKLPAKEQYSKLLRLAVVGIASNIGFNVDEIDDIKLGIDEAFTIAVRTAENENFEAAFHLYEDRLEIIVENLSSVEDEEEDVYLRLGVDLLQSVMDIAEWESTGGERLRMVKLKK